MIHGKRYPETFRKKIKFLFCYYRIQKFLQFFYQVIECPPPPLPPSLFVQMHVSVVYLPHFNICIMIKSPECNDVDRCPEVQKENEEKVTLTPVYSPASAFAEVYI